jgi:hypothetical protein
MSNLQKQSKVGSNALGAGLTLAVSVGLFAYGGLWLDAKWGTRPWMLLLCVCLGIVGGILHLIRVLAPEFWPFGRLPKDGPQPPKTLPPTTSTPKTSPPKT